MTFHNFPEAELRIIQAQPKRLDMPPHLQAAKDKKLSAALLAEFNSADIAERAMRVIKEQRS